MLIFGNVIAPPMVLNFGHSVLIFIPIIILEYITACLFSQFILKEKNNFNLILGAVIQGNIVSSIIGLVIAYFISQMAWIPPDFYFNEALIIFLILSVLIETSSYRQCFIKIDSAVRVKKKNLFNSLFLKQIYICFLANVVSYSLCIALLLPYTGLLNFFWTYNPYSLNYLTQSKILNIFDKQIDFYEKNLTFANNLTQLFPEKMIRLYETDPNQSSQQLVQENELQSQFYHVKIEINQAEKNMITMAQAQYPDLLNITGKMLIKDNKQGILAICSLQNSKNFNINKFVPQLINNELKCPEKSQRKIERKIEINLNNN